jgi:hypothetical protein
MRVKLHGKANDVGYLVETPVIHAEHGVQNAALHGFQPVVNVRHCPFKNHV